MESTIIPVAETDNAEEQSVEKVTRLPLQPISGTYVSVVKPPPWPEIDPKIIPMPQGELRLDVDGFYPQMTVSYMSRPGRSRANYWIASLTRGKGNIFSGSIWYSSPSILPNAKVTLSVDLQAHTLSLKIVSNGKTWVGNFRQTSDKFHRMQIEYDYADDCTKAFVSFDTSTHSNRPSSLPLGTLTIEDVYDRAGFRVRTSPGCGKVPLTLAGADGAWGDDELHDAMVAHWTAYSTNPRWAAWLFFASKSTSGDGLGGIMFDETAPTRQGCAVFVDSFIGDPPANDPEADAAVERLRFWCGLHEFGHCLNLAHTWQKRLSYQGGNPWIDTLVDDIESRSIMNYPFNVAGADPAYFQDHEFRFDDRELVFLRHAPHEFVRPGDIQWFHEHGFESPASQNAPLQLTVRSSRGRAIFEFMECVMLELKLQNCSKKPTIVDHRILATENLRVIIQRAGGTAYQYMPHARHLYNKTPLVLGPGESLYQSLMLFAGKNGFYFTEPGDYTVHVQLLQGQDLICSKPLKVRILLPGGRDEEVFAQDFFEADVGKVLAFDGSRVLEKAINTLREAGERFPRHPIANHAHVALASSCARNTKVLRIKKDGTKGIEVFAADPKATQMHFEKGLLENTDRAVSTLEHVDFNHYACQFIEWLHTRGDKAGASKVAAVLSEQLEKFKAPAAVRQVATEHIAKNTEK